MLMVTTLLTMLSAACRLDQGQSTVVSWPEQLACASSTRTNEATVVVDVTAGSSPSTNMVAWYAQHHQSEPHECSITIVQNHWSSHAAHTLATGRVSAKPYISP